MTSETQSELEQELRDWASGMRPLVAATEMLIRAGYARAGNSWIRYDQDNQRHWIDFASIPETIGGLSGGEKRFLRLAASLAADEPIVLGDEVSGLDHKHADLLLAGIAHAAGFNEPTTTVAIVAGEIVRMPVDPLYEWPTN